MYFYMQVFIFVVFVTFCVFLDVFTQCAFWHQSKSLLVCQFFHRVMQTGARINFLCL